MKQERDFRCLAAISEEAFDFVLEASDDEEDNPRVSGARTGDALEWVAEWIGETEGFPRWDKGEMDEEKASAYYGRLQDHDLIPRDLVRAFSDIRAIRNRAVHRKPVTAAHSTRALDLLETIVRWLEQHYGIAPVRVQPREGPQARVRARRSVRILGTSASPANSPIDLDRPKITAEILPYPEDRYECWWVLATPDQAENGGVVEFCERDGSRGMVHIPPQTNDRTIIRRTGGESVKIMRGSSFDMRHDERGTSIRHLVDRKIVKDGGSAAVRTPEVLAKLTFEPDPTGAADEGYERTVVVAGGGLVRFKRKRHDLTIVVTCLPEVQPAPQAPQELDPDHSRLITVEVRRAR